MARSNKAEAEVDTRETFEKRLEHRMLTDEVTSPIAVRPRCDIDAEEMTDNKIEENADRPKSDMDAEAFDEHAKNKHDNENDAAAVANIFKLMMKSRRKMWRLRYLLKKHFLR